MSTPRTAGEREAARLRQRKRRSGMRRIDYYPDATAVIAINSLRTSFAGSDASSILNRIVREWLEQRRRPA